MEARDSKILQKCEDIRALSILEKCSWILQQYNKRLLYFKYSWLDIHCKASIRIRIRIFFNVDNKQKWTLPADEETWRSIGMDYQFAYFSNSVFLGISASCRLEENQILLFHYWILTRFSTWDIILMAGLSIKDEISKTSISLNWPLFRGSS